MIQPHPFSNYADLPRSVARDNPLREAPQSPYGKRWCPQCKDMKPTKGSQTRPFFVCAGCRKPKGMAS